MFLQENNMYLLDNLSFNIRQIVVHHWQKDKYYKGGLNTFSCV